MPDCTIRAVNKWHSLLANKHSKHSTHVSLLNISIRSCTASAHEPRQHQTKSPNDRTKTQVRTSTPKHQHITIAPPHPTSRDDMSQQNPSPTPRCRYEQVHPSINTSRDNPLPTTITTLALTTKQYPSNICKAHCRPRTQPTSPRIEIEATNTVTTIFTSVIHHKKRTQHQV